MSIWTHIASCIYLETDIRSNNIDIIIKNILEQAPQITGSESNADIFVNVLSGSNTFIGADCSHCPFGHTKKNLPKGGFKCSAPEEYECEEGEYQTSVAITIIGDLRDKTKEETKKEYNALIKWLKERNFSIRIKSCEIKEF